MNRGGTRRGLALLVLTGILALPACGALGAGWSGRPSPPRDTTPTRSTPREPIYTGPLPTVEELRASGPTFVRYDEGPELKRTERLTSLLETHLLPVIEERALPLRTYALYWVLVTGEGKVAEIVLHTSSSVEAFDQAAAEVARSLQYEPAERGGRATPVWVLSRVHLRMP